MNTKQLKKLPKCEFHLHLEGSLPWNLLNKKDPKRFSEPLCLWNDDYRFPDFSDFDRELLSMSGVWFTSAEQYALGAAAIFEEAQNQGVVYLETSIGSGCLEFQKLDLEEVFSAVRSVVPRGLEVRIFLGIHHSGYSSEYAPTIEKSLECKNLDGYDIHGDEREELGEWAADFFRRAREAGKFTKCHAGEFCGPDFVKKAVLELGVSRIEHGVRSIEDEELLSILCEKKVTLDVCPFSNVKLKVASSFENHQLPKLLKAGVRCTINRDDPLLFGSTLIEEYDVIHTRMGCSDKELIALVKNGYETALISDEKKAEYYKMLDTIIEAENIA